MSKILAADGKPLNGQPQKRLAGYAAAYRYPWGEFGYLARAADGSPVLAPSLAGAAKCWIYDGAEQRAIAELSELTEAARTSLPRDTYRDLGGGDPREGQELAQRASLIRILL